MPAAFPLPPPPDRAPAIPDPPRFDLWPEALRSAERLRGSLVPCGPGLRGAGWPETPRVRIAALAPWLEHGAVAAHLTAAWVWGAARTPGRQLQVTTRARQRRRQADTEWLRVYEFRYSEAETHRFGAFDVTTPLRTVTDMLYAARPFGIVERVACRLLCREIEGGAATVLAELQDRRRPYRLHALRRFAELGAAALNAAPNAPNGAEGG